MRYWLVKSEPDEYSIDDLARDQTGVWDGVRNYQARNYLKEMNKGDLLLFYHSSCRPQAVAGIAKVIRTAEPDPTQFDPRNERYDPGSAPANPRWFQVAIAFVQKFAEALTLEEIKRIPALKNMVLLKRGRLSVQPVSPDEWAVVLKAKNQG
ncbi:MAG: EVE domain-containing protein [Elusimicrobia bacterium]|nr:EVE domain-containing protein [Elusimicrobiota bacterium]